MTTHCIRLRYFLSSNITVHHHHHHHRLYSPRWALVSSSKSRQRPLRCAAARQFLPTSFLASSSTPSIHLDLVDQVLVALHGLSIIPFQIIRFHPFAQYIPPIPIYWIFIKKYTLVQALRLCTGRMVHRGSSVIALFLTTALEGGEGSASRPVRSLPPRKTRYSLYRRLGEPQGRYGRAENLVPTGTRSRTVQPIVSRYTD